VKWKRASISDVTVMRVYILQVIACRTHTHSLSFFFSARELEYNYMSKYRVKHITRANYVSERWKFNDSFADFVHRQFRNHRLWRQAACLIRDRSFIYIYISRILPCLSFEKNENTERTTGLLPTCQSNISDSLENFYFLSYEWIVERADILILRNFRTFDLISSTV